MLSPVPPCAGLPSPPPPLPRQDVRKRPVLSVAKPSAPCVRPPAVAASSLVPAAVLSSHLCRAQLVAKA